MERATEIDKFIEALGKAYSGEIKKLGENMLALLNAEKEIPSNILAPASNCIAFTMGDEGERAVELISQGKVSHVIDILGPNIERHFYFALQLFAKKESFFSDPAKELFSSFSGKENNSFLSFPIKKIIDKREILSKLSDYLRDLKGISRIESELQLIADELITNILFNGPSSDQSSPDFTATNRKTKQSIVAGHNAHLFVFYRENRIYLGAVDSYGSLRLERVWGKLEKTFTDGLGASIDQGDGGAGVGMRLILDRADSLFLGVDKWKKTLVAVSMPLRSGKDREFPSKNVHLVCRE